MGPFVRSVPTRLTKRKGQQATLHPQLRASPSLPPPISIGCPPAASPPSPCPWPLPSGGDSRLLSGEGL
ncbi:hypothetical protein ZWY2020_010119 [Hordeum vulgare]|nr:hypothetical protein ZWY2020_006834 [Hordeum vulgare]KAI5009071.1 hypothetical protein ZWY2020_010119 [Hordeum vulgare]